jgi:small-conductance mechanosensitive channel
MMRIAWSALALLVTLALPAAIPPAPARAPVAPAPAAPAPAEKKAGSAAIPVPEVARQAEEAVHLLREFEAVLAPSPASDAAEKRLPEIGKRIARETEETRLAVEGDGAVTTLDALTTRWQTTRGELVGYINALARSATLAEEALGNLTRLQETWTLTRSEAQASRAPAQVITRIDGVLATITASRTRLLQHRGAILVLQDRVAQEVAQCDTMLARVAAARQGAAVGLLHRDGVPIWQAEQLASAFTDLPARIRVAAAADLAQLRQFGRDQRGRIAFQIVLFVGFLLLARAARRWAARSMSTGESGWNGMRVFDRPVSAALVPTLVLSMWIYTPPVPRAAAATVAILVLAPALRIMRRVLHRQVAPSIYVLGLFFLADLLRQLASVVPVLEQQILLIEMLAGMAVLIWRPVRWQAEPTGPETPSTRLPSIARVAVLVTFAVALVAGAAGYMRLALFLGAGVLGNGYLAVVFYAGVRIADGLVAVALRQRPLSALAMVRHNRPLLERRARLLLRILATGAWAFFALKYFHLWNDAVDAVSAALSATAQRGSLSISLGDLLAFALTVAAAFLVSRLVRFFLAEEVYPRLRLGRGLPDALSGALHYTLLLAGFLIGLAALGVDLTKVTILAGAFGVGIGFGLQNVVNNLVSGSILLVERKVNVGDAVQIGDVAGRVQQMGMRACTVRTWDGAEVIVPNASLIAGNVVNWTLSDLRRRIDVTVGVAYATPPEKALEVLLGVARAHPRVLAEPAPVALFRGFGESALRFELQVWTDRFDLWVQIQSELSVALYGALREAGIEIPFPQHEVHLHQG